MCRALFCCNGWDVGLRTRFTAAKWFYCVGFSATAIAVWCLRDYGGGFLADNISSFSDCLQAGSQDGVEDCAGQQVALRVSLANLVFFGAHLLGCIGLSRVEDVRVDVHAGLWVWQVLSWLGLLVGFMWLPPSILYGYGQFSRYASGVFLVLQLILLVNFVYEINEWLVEKDNKAAWAVLISGAVATFCLGLVLTGIDYHFFAPRASCSLNIFFVTWNLILGLALVGVLFIPGRAASAGLLTSGCVWLYCSYLIYSALASEPVPSDCARSGGVSAGWVGVVAFFIALAAVVYSTFTAGIASKDMFGVKGGDDAELPYRPDFFHVVFCTSSAYIAMLFTNWQVSHFSPGFTPDTRSSWGSTWVKVASSWACAALYGWTVVAPAVLKNRDFGPSV
ncbi:hypothetical protein HYH02_012332 [Chlamydomonas schloesseri]|uniref:Serine incorporator n=1 Tax=Chlamydomonas schloesseri TaxID=2026947 RepID=A0A835T8D8_9CHLO|nr:hypothetical protein HYH02_012332 [Chlamydomonas schloesseri]|eukprot:KAG2434310.1 hypothetical protein HYH02_012332 [Chlamydomonas schloesseri]